MINWVGTHLALLILIFLISLDTWNILLKPHIPMKLLLLLYVYSLLLLFNPQRTALELNFEHLEEDLKAYTSPNHICTLTTFLGSSTILGWMRNNRIRVHFNMDEVGMKTSQYGRLSSKGLSTYKVGYPTTERGL